jgi:hypothetical protein
MILQLPGCGKVGHCGAIPSFFLPFTPPLTASDPDYIFIAKGSVGHLETRRWRDDFDIRVIPFEATPAIPKSTPHLLGREY